MGARTLGGRSRLPRRPVPQASRMGGWRRQADAEAARGVRPGNAHGVRLSASACAASRGCTDPRLPDARRSAARAGRAPICSTPSTPASSGRTGIADFARANREDPVPFIGSVDTTADVVTVAAAMREILGFEMSERRQIATWSAAFDYLRDHADAAGVLVMVNGIVGSNTHRRLDPEEFRGFALADELAPVVFVNGADTKAAQIFTLAHELGSHVARRDGPVRCRPVRSPRQHGRAVVQSGGGRVPRTARHAPRGSCANCPT